MGDNGTGSVCSPSVPPVSTAGHRAYTAARRLRAAPRIPMTPAAAGGIAGRVDSPGVPAVFAGRWGDISQRRFDPRMFKGKGGRLRRAGGQPATGADTALRPVPDKFGAQAAAAVEATAAGARPSTRPRAGGPRDLRARRWRCGGAGDRTRRDAGSPPCRRRGHSRPCSRSPTRRRHRRCDDLERWRRPCSSASRSTGSPGDAGQTVTARWSHD